MSSTEIERTILNEATYNKIRQSAVAAETYIQTYEDYLALPETMQRYEIINGEMIMAPSPTVEHQWIVGRLFRTLDRYVEEHQLGDVFLAPLDVRIPDKRFRTRQPDLLFISVKRSGFTDRNSVRGIQLLDVGPELVVEVLSSSDTRKGIQEKLADYQKIGVCECWIVSPEAETVEVLFLTSNAVVRLALLGIGDRINSGVLPGLTFLVDEVFE